MPSSMQAVVVQRESSMVRASMLALASAWLAGCSVLVDPESLAVKCESPGLAEADPCIEAGMHCVGRTCQPCEGAREDCNGVDDDCDGAIDEGHDQDGDHYSWCGGGVPELADCVPTDPTIHPSAIHASDSRELPPAIELCDGKDNDCDGSVDESPECEQSESCVDIGCLPGRYCDEASGVCIAPLPVGSGCAGDSDCDNGFCVNPSEYQISGDAAAKVCASACCNDQDCSGGTVCEVTSRGARACLPSNIVGRGDVVAGADCREAADCASGVCAARTCRTRCRGDADCSEETDTCVLTAASGGPAYSWLCGRSAGHGSARGFCTVFDPTACGSAWCDDSACQVPCGRDADCMSGERCTYAEFTGLVPSSASLLGRCAASDAGTDPACCTNADCAAPTRCKPKALGDGWVMVCQPQ
jgi:hypothetical protein